MRKAIFRKVTDGFITLKVEGVPRKIGKGERFVAYYEVVNGMPGISFENFGDSIQNTDDMINFNENVFTFVGMPSSNQIKENVKPQDDGGDIQMPDNANPDKDCPKCNGKGKYHFGGSFGGPGHWTICDCVMFKTEETSTSVNTNVPQVSDLRGFDEETLKSLKSKTPKDWMLVKKGELKEIMDKAGIDYSQVKDDRMCLYKFLFNIIKDIS
jgi:hypothetical protein